LWRGLKLNQEAGCTRERFWGLVRGKSVPRTGEFQRDPKEKLRSGYPRIANWKKKGSGEKEKRHLKKSHRFTLGCKRTRRKHPLRGFLGGGIEKQKTLGKGKFKIGFCVVANRGGTRLDKTPKKKSPLQKRAIPK